MPESSADAISRQNINDDNTGGNGHDSEVVKRGRRGTYYRYMYHSYMHMTKWAGTKVSRRKRVHATSAAVSCRLAIYEKYTQEGSSDLADSVMAEIRPTEYVSGRAPAAHEHLARTARAKARTSAASYAAVGIKARAPPVLWPGRFVDPAVRPVRAVVLLRASVVSFGKDGTTMYLPSLHFGRGTLFVGFCAKRALEGISVTQKSRDTYALFLVFFSYCQVMQKVRA